jgi:N-acetylglucosamine kinase-like BadF-type ATPase
MVDLRASNSKLRARTNRIIRQLTKLDEASADQLLRSCDGELKTALVAQLTGKTPEEARSALVAAGNRVGAALAQARSVRRGAVHEMVLGIDGGGTHTVALLAEGNTVLGRGESGPSNMHAVGMTRACQSLEEAIQAAFAAAGVEPGTVRSACLGLAGADRPEEKELLTQWAERIRLAERVELTSDGSLLLAAGTPEGWGLALVSGTGSIVVGRGPDGQMSRSGGWGYLLGDEGSGYELVVSALKAILRERDGRGQPTALTGRLLEAMGLRSAQEMIPAVYSGGWDRPKLSALSPVVIAVADEGDVEAGKILETSADEIARAAEATVRSLQLTGKVIPVAMAGGVFLGAASYRQRVVRRMEELGIKVGSVSLVEVPALGAVRLAGRQMD